MTPKELLWKSKSNEYGDLIGSKLKMGFLIFAYHKFTVNFENPQIFINSNRLCTE